MIRARPASRALGSLTTGRHFRPAGFSALHFATGAFGITPHLIGAGVVTVLVVWTGCCRQAAFSAKFRSAPHSTILLHACFGTQSLLGGAAWWAVTAAADAVQPTFVLRAAHGSPRSGGALTLAASVLFTLTCFRLIPSADSAAANSRAVQAHAKHSPSGAGA